MLQGGAVVVVGDHVHMGMAGAVHDFYRVYVPALGQFNECFSQGMGGSVGDAQYLVNPFPHNLKRMFPGNGTPVCLAENSVNMVLLAEPGNLLIKGILDHHRSFPASFLQNRLMPDIA